MLTDKGATAQWEEAAMAKGFVLDPTTARADDITSPGPDAGPLTGKVIGIRVDQMWRAWDWISEIWADEFRKAGATDVKFWRSCGRSGEEGERMDRELKSFLASIDIALVGLANCGSCTGWTVHDALAASAAGLPTVAIATANFEEFAKTIAKRGGRSGLRVHVLPYPLNERFREDVDPVAHEHFARLIGTMGAEIESRKQAAA
ncbi:MAG: hypothetical protein JWM91_2927 [Rhodospirillales bacterium]|nr:hypothetical protein [Rhodospirillales bacterium]